MSNRASRRGIDSESILLKLALLRLYHNLPLFREEELLISKHFPDGVMFLTKAQYQYAVLHAPKTLTKGVVTVLHNGTVDIHTKVGVRSTK